MGTNDNEYFQTASNKCSGELYQIYAAYIMLLTLTTRANENRIT